MTNGTDVVETEITPDSNQHWKKTVNIIGETTSLSISSGEVLAYTRQEPIIRDNTVVLIYDHTLVLSVRTVGNTLQVEMTVNKLWAGIPAVIQNQNDWQPGVEIVLLSDGVEKERKALGSLETVKFENLPLYADLSSDMPITYTIKEELAGNWVKISESEWVSMDGLAKYTANVDVMENDRTWNITNTFSWMQDKLDIPVEKIWKDEEDRPASITLGLFTGLESDIPLKTVELTAVTLWKGLFSDLPIRDVQGNRIDYSSCVIKEKIGDSWIADGEIYQLDGKTYQFKE